MTGGLPGNPYNEHAWVIGEPDIGHGTWIGAFTVIDGSGGLTIGTGCDISSGVHIYTHSSARRCVSGRSYGVVDRAAVVIGDRVFIGANAVINMGVTIGPEAVIGAGAVVTKDVPARSIVAGVPGRVIGTVDLSDPGDPQLRSMGGPAALSPASPSASLLSEQPCDDTV
ncbi:acyltransferase [Microbacterium sp. QXD-8]|uniref:Acyltransferase n=1 Tax=Microbacterium psychrotolerans TaxID=3068321 RepID=A0ABU0Z2E9_9MICO|nr:acyltransferase [Microbacterium sp. QXD-8]MDQ7878753.1 acyltransferase [Microbacterium sp. QXD-8]